MGLLKGVNTMDVRGICRFSLKGKWTEETISLLERAIDGWWGDWLDYADDLFSGGLGFSTDHMETDILYWASITRVGFEDMVAASAGGPECAPDLSEYCPPLEEREEFDPEIHQALLNKMKEQKLKIRVRYVPTYLESMDGDDGGGVPEGWTEEEDLKEFGMVFTLSSNGKKFVIKE